MARRPGPDRVNAYILAADPSFLHSSLSAYYDRVDRIIVSYDRSARSWTGTALPVEQCLRIIDAIDVDGKCVRAPGDFARLDENALDNDTYQRQVATDQASEGARWVVQLDTDEVMSAPDTFFRMLARADDAGMGALDYPSRWIHSRSKPRRYLEGSDRFWRPIATYPASLAVRAGTRLTLARQSDVTPFRVDFRWVSTDPWRPRDAAVHAVIPFADAVLHFSWVRDPAAMRRKFGWSGHHESMTPPEVYRKWEWSMRHPYLTAAVAPVRRVVDGRYRVCTINEPPGGEPPALNVD